ncbi:hypothetical protein [uncultured Sphingomonas sp.]|uniref:hypothetical protein n=1 Tax=uncultured Sphingomonas sp. TaxID=158754 RepID=UPI0025E14854|nr:hypothetical protein [uncultured Sphingomonas sp.]
MHAAPARPTLADPLVPPSPSCINERHRACVPGSFGVEGIDPLARVVTRSIEQQGTRKMSEHVEGEAFHEQSEVPISYGLYYLAFLLVATLTMLLIAGNVIG